MITITKKLIINSADSCSHRSARITTTINVSDSHIKIYLQCDDKWDVSLSATSFIEGNIASGSPFLVTLPSRTLDEEVPRPINIVNATSTLNIAQLITGQGKRDFSPMLDILTTDFLPNHPKIIALGALGPSAHSEYLLRALCFYSMKNDPGFSNNNIEMIKEISLRLQTLAFSVNRYSSADDKKMVLSAMKLTKFHNSDTHSKKR